MKAGYTMDLFGNEHPVAGSQGAPVQLSAFDHAAERAAIDSGRAVSQERVELVAPAPVGGRCAIHGTPNLLQHGGGYSCPRCS